MKISKPTKASGTSPTSARTMGNKVAGGIGSRTVSPQGVRNGAPARGISPGAVSQLGESVGNHATEHTKVLPYKGEKWTDGKTPAGGAVPLGNSVALNVKGGGPGTGREVFKCGSQGQSGPVRSPNAQGRDILGEFGPDSSNARNRR